MALVLSHWSGTWVYSLPKSPMAVLRPWPRHCCLGWSNHSDWQKWTVIQCSYTGATKLQKIMAQGQVTRYKHVKGLGLPYMVHAAQPTLMKRVASFLLASEPLWDPPPPARSWLPHNHLYSSPRRFPVEPHLLLGCSHKIPNGTSSTFDLPPCSTATSNTILGLSSQGPPWHVLPHAAPGFFAGRGCTGRWSSPNFASILLASSDNTSTLGWTHTKPGRDYIIN
jgi:hypothetical protein